MGKFLENGQYNGCAQKKILDGARKGKCKSVDSVEAI